MRTLRTHIDWLIKKHGSLRAAARAVRVDHGYMARLQSGQKDAPSATTLRKLGLRRVTRYEVAA